MFQLDYLLRLIAASACGASIGYERKNRMKEAGVRTHFIVAIGSALMMIVSKYGFQDQIGWDNMSLDPSRVAAQVVSGVGFLGAGIIFMQRETIKGLTTAAGIWATAGIGLAVGSGLYFVGIAATLLVIFGQVLLHGKFKWLSSLSSPKTEVLTLQILNEPGSAQHLREIFQRHSAAILSLKIKDSKKTAGTLDVKAVIRVAGGFDTPQLVCRLQDDPQVAAVEY
ncbi:MgtC/SapB family protein [Saccharibacillus sp. CPCC 101409]|uniref:MgtC/SapB family protein n=1 Tax=Saccharibacillus sp. CPCC 101409 TaxID=3058041 RepID=UPI002672D816|nr:MgtC/SapB family protein [Saccharibacillus sp. CPCC 101409]MDO3411255.1 MgtC/SapB family protein [Saccharibacillus sp. CPCC 101409]